MATAVHQALLGLSAAALGASALRLASLAAPSGLERAVGACTFAAGLAAFEALALGLVGLGSNPWVLPAAASATFLASVRLPRPGLPLGAELTAWWRRTGPLPRTALAAIFGCWLLWSAWLVRHPALGIDSITYHVPEVLAWVHSGSPGEVVSVLPRLSVGNYPLTNEVLLAWGTGIGRNFLFLTLWSPLLLLLLTGSGWLGLRRLAVPPPIALLALGAVMAIPFVTNHQMNGANTDLPALAWLVSSGALAAAAVDRPGLLAPAVVAAGLAVGTKTTTAPLEAVVLLLALVALRRRLRPLWRPLSMALVVALAIGGVWYLRNLVNHGSPLWPFAGSPWGDPAPAYFAHAPTFLGHPAETVRRIGRDYLHVFGGGLVLLGGAMLAPAFARRREVALCAVLTVLSSLLWAAAPLTGVGRLRLTDFTTLSTLRYLVPGVAVAALTLALASRGPGLGRRYATTVLAGALAVGAWQTFRLGYPNVPTAAVPLAGAVAGAALVAAIELVRLQMPGVDSSAPGAGAVLAVAVAVALSPAAAGYARRHAATGMFDSEIVRWAAGQPGFGSGHRPIAMAPVLSGALAGDRLQHRLSLITGNESCRSVLARIRRSLVIVHRNSLQAGPSAVQRCLARVRPAHAGATFRSYGALRGSGAKRALRHGDSRPGRD